MKGVDNLILRPALRAEANEIAALSRIYIEQGLRWRWRGPRVRAALAEPETMVLVGAHGPRIVGFAIMHFGEVEAHLSLLAVRPSFRRAGVASAMLAWLEKSALTAGLQRVRLEVRATNWDARAFYRRLGFRFVGQVAGYYDGVEAAVVMVRTIAVTARDAPED